MTQNTEGTDVSQIRQTLDELQQEPLEPPAPEKWWEIYLRQREVERTRSTIEDHKTRIAKIITWCNKQEKEDL